jgi:transcriptional regulator with XRE-family HTH domain
MRTLHTEQARQLAARLRQARDAAKLTQTVVSVATGIPQPHLSAMEHGQRKVTALELAALAKLYRKPLRWFVD